MEKNNKIRIISATALAAAAFVANPAAAQIARNTAQMQAMDKITGRVEIIDVPINTEVKYGSFSVVVRSCKARPPEETPENFAFVDVVDNPLKEDPVNIFKGWMLSSNPAINPVEHPIYDIWLLKCYNTEIDEEKQMSPQELKERDFIVSTQVVPAKEQEPTTNPIDDIIDENMSFAQDEMPQESNDEENEEAENGVNEPDEENFGAQPENVEDSFVEFSVSEDVELEPEAEQQPAPQDETYIEEDHEQEY